MSKHSLKTDILVQSQINSSEKKNEPVLEIWMWILKKNNFFFFGIWFGYWKTLSIFGTIWECEIYGLNCSFYKT